MASTSSICYVTLEKVQTKGKIRDFYQAGISANSAGLTVCFMPIDDRIHLRRAYDPAIGKAEVTG